MLDRRIKHKQLIVAEKHGALWYLSWSLVAIALAAFFFGFGYFAHHIKSRKEMLRVESFEQEYQEALASQKASKERLVVVEKALEIEKASKGALLADIKANQSEIHDLSSELRFYRQVMAPEREIVGLHIDSLEIMQNTDNSGFIFALTLIQAKKHTNLIKGRAKIDVEGELDSKPHTVTISYDNGETNFPFAFRYFQVIDGDINMPDKFVPKSLKVTVKTKGKKGKTEFKAFNWQVKEA